MGSALTVSQSSEGARKRRRGGVEAKKEDNRGKSCNCTNRQECGASSNRQEDPPGNKKQRGDKKGVEDTVTTASTDSDREVTTGRQTAEREQTNEKQVEERYAQASE